MTPQKAAPAAPEASGRRAWIKKTPVQIVLEQLDKQSEKVAELREELAHEERELEKLEKARKVLEAT